MSYQLAFWRQTDTALDAKLVYAQACEGTTHIAGLASTSPTSVIEHVVSQLASFKAVNEVVAEKLDWQIDFESPDKGSFSLSRMGEVYIATCYGMDGDELNGIVDAFIAAGCALYDPQEDERFAQPN